MYIGGSLQALLREFKGLFKAITLLSLEINLGSPWEPFLDPFKGPYKAL